MSARSALPPAAALAYRIYQLAALGYAGYLGLRRLLGSSRRGSAGLVEERLGRWAGRPRPAAAPCIWVHAASLGEVLLVGPLLARLRSSRPEAHLLVTSNTATGRAAAEQVNADEVRYFPIDYAPIMERVLGQVRPTVLIFVETEIWPGLLFELAALDIVAVMVNARISARSYGRYRCVRGLLRAALACVAMACARDEESARRLVALGVDAARLRVVGDLKLDAIDAGEVAETPDLLGEMTTDGPVLLAISTHEGEDEVVLEAYRQLREDHGGLRLVLAPRHPERSRGVLRLASAVATAALWSELCGGGASRDWEVLVIDTTGQLRGFMKGATAAFVGGSIGSVGGHNLLEPAAFALPLVSGPSLNNVVDQSRALRECGCLETAGDAATLATAWSRWLDDAEARAQRAAALASFVATHGGALDATVSAIDELVPGPGQRDVTEG